MKTQTFKSRRDPLFSGIMLVVCLFLLVMIVVFLFDKNPHQTGQYIAMLATAITLGFMLWTFFSLGYQLTEKELFYYSGPIKGTIAIDSITKIEKGKTMWSGTRAAAARNGLIIRFGKFDELYISPDSNETFIQEILKINPKIQIEAS